MAEEFENDFLNALIQTAEEILPDVRDFVFQLVDDPYPPSSEPGTPPHRRLGNFQSTMTFETRVDEADTQVYLEIRSPMPYTPHLENGTDTMAPRPMWDLVNQTMATMAEERLAQILASHSE